MAYLSGTDTTAPITTSFDLGERVGRLTRSSGHSWRADMPCVGNGVKPSNVSGHWPATLVWRRTGV